MFSWQHEEHLSRVILKSGAHKNTIILASIKTKVASAGYVHVQSPSWHLKLCGVVSNMAAAHKTHAANYKAFF